MMRNWVLAAAAMFAIQLVWTPASSATEPVSREVAAEVTPQIITVDQPASEQLQLIRVEIERPAATDDAIATQFAPRGSFWWLVGVIVVAGVILAIVL